MRAVSITALVLALSGALAGAAWAGQTGVVSQRASAGAAGTPNAGDVYIADELAGNVVAVPAGGGPQSTVVSGLTQPGAVAVDDQGDLFIAEVGTNTVVEQPAGGGTQTTVGTGLSSPTGMAVDAQGDVFIADRGNNRVVEVPAGGGTETTVGSGLSQPQGVAVDAQGDVFIADRGLNQVVKVPAGGGAQTTLGTGLSAPEGVAVDAAGDVFIADTGNAQVVEVPAGGGAQRTVGSGFKLPSAVAIDAAGNVYVADPGNGDVVELPADGGPQTTVGDGLHFPTGVAAYAPPPTFSSDSPGNGRQGNAYSYSYAASTAAGEPPATFAVASGALPPGVNLDPGTGVLSGRPTTVGVYSFTIEAENTATGTVGAQNTITVGPPITAGDLFVSDLLSQTVLELAAGGAVTSLGTGLDGVQGLALDANEDVFASIPVPYKILKFSADTQTQSQLNDPYLADGGKAGGVAVDPTGQDVFVANTDWATGTIDEITPSVVYPSIDHAHVYYPEGLAMDSQGDLWIADTGANWVEEMAPIPPPQRWNTPAPVVDTGLNEPTAVAVDAKGDVYIADTGSGRVLEEPAGGGSLITIATGFDLVNGLAIDAYGDVFISDGNTGRIYEEPAGGGAQIQLPDPFPGSTRPYLANGVAVYAPAPTFTADSPPGVAGVGTIYNYSYVATTPANEPAALFSVASGSLPPGLSLNPTTGLLSGDPTTEGTYTFTIETANAANGTIGPATTIDVGASIATHTLTVGALGTGTGTVSSAPPVLSCPDTCAATFGDGTEVTLTATPAPGSTFAGWSGGGCTGTGACLVTMSSDQTVSADFTAVGNHVLAVTRAGSGTGTVTSSPSGITCGGTCTGNFAAGEPVTLSASPAPGSVFGGWSGAGCSGTGVCTVTMSSDRTVTATFTPAPPGDHALWVSKAGPGSGTVTSSPTRIDCGATCSAVWPDGTTVTLTATATSGSTFAGWSGACSGTGSCSLTLASDQHVTANFTTPAASAAPVLTALRLSPHVLGRRRAHRATLTFRLDVPAKVTITVSRLIPGRMVHRRCVKAVRRNRRDRRCTRAVLLKGSQTDMGQSGPNRTLFNGRIGGRRLAPGTYRLIASATAAGGGTSRPQTVTMRVTG